MTITFSGGTGVSTTGAARGTTSTTVAYNNVAAGRMAILTVGAKPNTGTIATPSGWTLIGTATGGTGTNAADTGQTRVSVFYRVLDGTETGSVTVTGTSTGSIQGVMDVYAKTRGNWDVPAFVSGNDSSHGANFSAACGAWGAGGVWSGDWIHAAYSGDTDDSTTATSAPTITQSGMTIGTVTGRSQVRNTSGNQGMSYTWSAEVGAHTTAGTSNVAAPTVGFTWTVSSCGPAMAVRLREFDLTESLVDTFDTGDSTKWPFGTGVVTVTGGTLQLDANAAGAGYSALYSAQVYKLKGSSIVMQFPAIQTGAGSYGDMTIRPYADNTGTGFVFDPSSGMTSFIDQLGGVDGGYTEIPYTSGSVTWRKIDYTGSNILLQTSSDGSTWTTQRTVTPSAWHDYTNLLLIFEAGGSATSPDPLVVDNVNNAPTSEVHTTSGTAATTVTATAARATARTTSGTATASVTATATRSTARAPAGTASTTVTATAARAGAHTTAGTAAVTVTASAVAGGARPTARTAPVTVTATAADATARTTTGTASATVAATATRSTSRTVARTATVTVTASAVAAGVRPTARTAPVTVTASAAEATTRATARSATVAVTATAARLTVRSTSGTAQVLVVATGVVEGEETHSTSGTAAVTVTASATRSTSRTTARTAPVTVSATAARSTARSTTGPAGVTVTASATSSGTEPHTTSGTAPVTVTATASATGVHVVARIAPVTVAALAARSTSRATAGSAAVALSATAATGSGKSGHPRIVDRERAAILTSAGRQSRIVDSTRPSRRTG